MWPVLIALLLSYLQIPGQSRNIAQRKAHQASEKDGDRDCDVSAALPQVGSGQTRTEVVLRPRWRHGERILILFVSPDIIEFVECFL